jgi:hypothetical protein
MLMTFLNPFDTYALDASRAITSCNVGHAACIGGTKIIAGKAWLIVARALHRLATHFRHTFSTLIKLLGMDAIMKPSSRKSRPAPFEVTRFITRVTRSKLPRCKERPQVSGSSDNFSVNAGSKN